MGRAGKREGEAGVGLHFPAPTAGCLVLEHPAVPSHHIQHPSPWAQGPYRNVSFAIEPIQLPIVPLNWFWLHWLHTTAVRERGADRSR